MIDQVILEKPVDEDEFEDLLEALVCGNVATFAPVSAAPATSSPPASAMSASPDAERELLLQAWPQLNSAVRQAILTLAQAARQMN